MQTSETAIQFLINYSFFFISYIAIIYFHEAGHYFTAKILKLKTDGFRVGKLFYIFPIPTAVKVRFEDKYQENIKKYNVKYASVVANGVLAGLIPLWIYLYYLDYSVGTVIYGCLYLFMSSNDLTRLIQLLSGKDLIADYNLYEEVEVTVHIPETGEECLSVYLRERGGTARRPLPLGRG